MQNQSKPTSGSVYSKDFILVAIGQIISLFGNQILRYALPLYLLNETGSSALFGTILAVSFIPMLLLFPVGGIVADRFNKRNIMVILDFSTSLLVFLFALSIGRLDIVPLMAVTMILLYGIQGAYQPTVKAAIPALVDEAHIMQGNSIVDLINSLGSMGGPVIGGILYSLVGLSPILYVSIGCFFLSAVMEIFIRIPYTKQAGEGNIIATGAKDLKASFSFVFRQQPILWKMSLVMSSTNLFLTTLILIAFPVLITQRLGFEPQTATRLYGYAQGVLAGGCVLGGILAGLCSKRLKLKSSSWILAGCALPVFFSGVGLHILNNPMQIYMFLLAGGGLMLIMSTLLQILLMSRLQILTPPELTGKVISCVMCICMCTNPVGQFMYGLIFEHIGRYSYLPFYGASVIVLGIAVLTRSVFKEGDRPADSTQVGEPAVIR